MKTSFSDILSRAIAGDQKAIEFILEMYAPLIDHHSMVYGYMDEDCRQYIMIKIALSISKFII